MLKRSSSREWRKHIEFQSKERTPKRDRSVYYDVSEDREHPQKRPVRRKKIATPEKRRESDSDGGSSDDERGRRRKKPEKEHGGPRKRGGRSPSSSGDSDVNSEVLSSSSRRQIKPRTYDGTTSFETLWAHFECCSDYNRWKPSDKLAYLKAALTGDAGQVLWDSDPKDTHTI